MNEITDILVKLAAALLAVGATYFIARIRGYLNTKLDSEELEVLDRLIGEFTKAAEQQFKETDKTGEVRFEYVAGLLSELGYEVTDIVKAKIEAKVFEINLPEIFR